MNCSTLMPPFHAVYVAIWMVALPGWHITRSKVPERSARHPELPRVTDTVKAPQTDHKTVLGGEPGLR